MKVRVHYYAAARELAGCDAATFDFPAEVVEQDDFRRAVSARHPSIAAFVERMRLAVNGDFVDDSLQIRDGDRVDLMPPVAGGASVVRCEIIDSAISLDGLRNAVAHPGAGGICIFTGVVRDNADGKDLARLDYEAHESLALKEMQRVLEGVAAEYSGVRLAAVHRVGQLAVGDIAVCVAASAPHRDEAFTACRKAIDRIKETVPVWKKEWGASGEANWVNLES